MPGRKRLGVSAAPRGRRPDEKDLLTSESGKVDKGASGARISNRYCS